MTATAASSRCIRTWCWASSTIISRTFSRTTSCATATRSTPTSTPRTGASSIGRYKERVEEELGKPFPQNPDEQLWGAIGAVFGSWMNQRAKTYRRLHNIPESWGTAVNVQAMVFGNMGDTSATGVAFTRNPSTGEKRLYGEFLINAQGEDVVAGIRTPQEITEEARIEAGSDKPSMESAMPASVQGAGCASTPSSKSTTATCRTWSSRSSRASSGCSRPATASAPRKRRAAHRGGTRERAADHARGGGHARRARLARPASASDHRSRCRARRDRDGASGVARRGLRRDRVFVGRGRQAQGRRQARSSSCAWRPRPRTFTACTPPKAFSPRAAA